jgi:hypothetical protein
VETENAYQIDGAVIMKMIVVIIQTSSIVKDINVKMEHSNANRDIA